MNLNPFRSELDRAQSALQSAQRDASKAAKAASEALAAVVDAEQACSAVTTEDDALRASARLLLAKNRAASAKREADDASAKVDTSRKAVSDVQDAIAARELLGQIDSAKRTTDLDDLHCRTNEAATRVRVLSEEIQKALASIYGEFDRSVEAQAFLSRHGVQVDPLNKYHKYTGLALAFLEGANSIDDAIAALEKVDRMAAAHLKAIVSNSWCRDPESLIVFMQRPDLSRDQESQEKRRAANRQRLNDLKAWCKSNPLPDHTHPTARVELSSQLAQLLSDPIHCTESAVREYMREFEIKTAPRYGRTAGVIETSLH